MYYQHLIHILLVMLLTVLLLGIINFHAFADDAANELVKKADLHRGIQTSHLVFAKTISNDNGDITEQEYLVKVRDFETSLVEQVAPIRARGRKLLMKGLDMWLFTPQLKKSVRVSLQQRLTGEIANGDIARTNYSQDYEAAIIGEDKKLNSKILELTSKDKRVTYHKIKYWIENNTHRPLRAEFFALSGKFMKWAIFSDFKNVGGIDMMHKMFIQDAVVSTKNSTLLYRKRQAQKFQSSLFNKEQMDR